MGWRAERHPEPGHAARGRNTTVTATFVDSSSGGGTARPMLPTFRIIVGYFAQWAIFSARATW